MGLSIRWNVKSQFSDQPFYNPFMASQGKKVAE
jgi:hypothetical protein